MGGAKIGLMGAVADGCLQHGGEVIGVLPKFLDSKEIAHDGISQLIYVDSMHERKLKMSELCDGVIALPGGFGTMDEMFEMLTWAQLGLHQKPIGLLNWRDFYVPILHQIDIMVQEGFLKLVNQEMLLVDTEVADLVEKMKTYQAPDIPKWIDAANA